MAFTHPRDLLKSLLEGNPKASRDQIFSIYQEEISRPSNAALLKGIVSYWLEHNYRSFVGDALSPAVRAQRKQETAMVVSKIKAKVKAKVREEAQLLLLDLMQPNGKLLRDCTGRDLVKLSKKASPWLERLADRVTGNARVGDVLSERQVRSMYDVASAHGRGSPAFTGQHAAH